MNPDDVKAAICHHFPNAHMAAIERLKGGVSAAVYRVDLRLPDGSRQSVVLRGMGKSGLQSGQEFLLLSALHLGGLTVPRPIYFDDRQETIKVPYLLMDFVDGSTQIPIDAAKDRLATIAKTLAQVHRFPSQTLPELPSRINPLENLPEMMPNGPQWRGLRDYIATCDGVEFHGLHVLLHGDFWPQNLIWQGNKIAAIVDWEDAAIGDPLSDVACTVLELKYLFDDTMVDHFIQSYSRHLPIDARRMALWLLYVASAAQHYMGHWGLEPSREAHMREIALAQIRASGATLLALHTRL
jgi:aminoglycoside phosphotransferase (APT) family kinase protein